MKKTIVTVLISIILNQIIQAQEILVKNLQGQDVSMTSILQQSKKDQPTVLLAWSKRFCGSPCFNTIQGFMDRYPELEKKYNLRVVLINVDGISKENRDRTISITQEDYPGVQSLTDYVKIEGKEKKWIFESYVDEYGNFSKAVNLTETPLTYLFLNSKIEVIIRGWGLANNQRLKETEFDTGLLDKPTDFPAVFIQKILEQMNGYESYFTDNWMYTLKEFKPTYKRTVVKIGNLFEITDSWITGEMLTHATCKDKMGTIYEGVTTSYFKNGNIKGKVNYEDNVLNGLTVEYYENGKVNWKGSYKNGKYDGKWEGFYDNGIPMTQKIWTEGKLLKINYFTDTDGQSLLQNGTGIYKEYYQNKVVKSIQKYREHQKNGEWKYFYENGKLSAIINYEDNKAHGTFTTYHKNGKLKTKGNYWEGKKDSVWTYYDEEGKETNSELWERGLKSDLEAKKKVEKMETLPTFKGGKQALSSYLSQNMNYPETAKKIGIQGKVFVEFVISKDGSIQNVKLLKGVQNDLDNEAIRLIKNMPNWVPGEIRGKKVSVKQVIPINFSLQ